MRGELRRSLVFSILFSFCIAGVAPAVADVYYVQVSSQSSEAAVVAAYKSLQSLFPNELGNRQLLIHRADLGYKGIYFRAMVGPFTNNQEAAALCSNMMAAGGQCLVQSDSGTVLVDSARKAVTAKPKAETRDDFKADLDRKVAAHIKECQQNGEPAIGMTKSRLLETCWGKPRSTNTTVTAYGTSEQLVYWSGNYVYLRNGVVEAIQK